MWKKLITIVAILVYCSYNASAQCKGNIAYNTCGERCLCSNGKMTQCTRIRRDFMSMPWGERLRFVRTFLTVSTKEPYKSEYDGLVSMHTRNFKKGIHTKAQFLPWHRWYLLQMENLFRNVDCRVAMPYWDWSLFSGQPWRKTLNDVFSSAPWGLGGNGGRGLCVADGPFNRYHWSTTPSNGRECLKRSFNGNPPDIVSVVEVLNYKLHEFDDFEIGIRDTLHNNMHCRIGGSGGTMCSTSSANAPEFLLHHGFTDKLWADWQKKGKDYKSVYFKWVTHTMWETGLKPSVVLDLENQPGDVRIIYEDPLHSNYHDVHRYLQELIKDDKRALENIPRHRFTLTQSLEFKVFMVGSKERKKVQAQQNTFEPKHLLNSKVHLSNTDKELGFRVLDVERALKRKREMTKRTQKRNKELLL